MLLRQPPRVAEHLCCSAQYTPARAVHGLEVPRCGSSAAPLLTPPELPGTSSARSCRSGRTAPASTLHGCTHPSLGSRLLSRSDLREVTLSEREMMISMTFVLTPALPGMLIFTPHLSRAVLTFMLTPALPRMLLR